MSVSVKRVNQVQIVLDDETAELVRQLAYAVSWDQFPQAEKLVDALGAADLDAEVNIEFNTDSGQFERA